MTRMLGVNLGVAFVEGERYTLVYCPSQREWGGCIPIVGLLVRPYMIRIVHHVSYARIKKLTLLFENNNFTPLPVVVLVIVLYSPSSSSLKA